MPLPTDPIQSRPPTCGWTVRGHVPPEAFVIQAHRGAGALAEENTREAFELGWAMNAVPEADVRATADGVIVAFHDRDFSRVVKDAPAELRHKGVEQVTWDELARLDVGAYEGDRFAGRRVTRLGDVFDLMRGRPQRRLYLDVKQVDLARLADEATSRDVAGQVILASTGHSDLRRWRRLVSSGQTLLWMGGNEAALRERLADLRATGFADVAQLQVHVHVRGDAADVTRHSIDPFAVSDAFLRGVGDELRPRGILFQALPYGGTTAAIYFKLLDLGVMSFATDHPDVTLDAVRRYYDAG